MAGDASNDQAPPPVDGAAWLELSQGQWALVDNEDLDRVSTRRWHLKVQRKNPGKYYAQTTVVIGGKKTSLQLHRFLLDAPADAFVDHRNGNPLDNRRENLRLCTNRQNQENVVHSKNRKRGGWKGVCWNPTSGKWQAQICAGTLKPNGKRAQIYLGVFVDPTDAARAYDAAALKYFGDFAALNFPESAPSPLAAGGDGP